jgi:hypothetical protein
MANVTLGTLRDYWKALSDIIKTGGAATGTKGLQVAGSDGTNAQILKTNANGELLTTLTGSSLELYGKTIADRPAANTVAEGTTFTIIDANLDQNWISDGTNWLEV